MTKFHFPTFHEMFPVEKRKLKLLREWLRYRARRLVFAVQCQALVDFIHENPLWQPVFAQYPYRVNTLLSQYCDKHFNATQRLDSIKTNFAMAEKHFGVSLCETLISQQPVLLAQLTDELALNLTLNHIDPYEGFFAIGLTDANQRTIYSASFTFLADNRLLIASIQGPKGDEAQDLVRQATKLLHGVRPMFMLVNAFKVFAETLNCHLTIHSPHHFSAQTEYPNDGQDQPIPFHWLNRHGVLTRPMPSHDKLRRNPTTQNLVFLPMRNIKCLYRHRLVRQP